MIIYLAGPFFNEKQNFVIIKLENLIEDAGFTLISPRRIGVLKSMTAEERRAAAPQIYQKNRSDIAASDAMLAVIDDRDQGTTWEMGFIDGLDYHIYHSAAKRPVYTFSNHGHGLNVMIQGGIKAHARGFEQAARMLQAIKSDSSLEEFPVAAAVT
jgi:nucleoside 2-deoxyribosyltransferase